MEQVHHMVDPEVLAGHVDRLKESFWPDDVWAAVPPRSEKEMEDTRLQAQVCKHCRAVCSARIQGVESRRRCYIELHCCTKPGSASK